MPLCFSNVHRFLVFMTFSFWISVSVSVQAHLFFKAHYEQIYTGWCMKWNALKDFSINSSKFNFLTCYHRFKKKKKKIWKSEQISVICYAFGRFQFFKAKTISFQCVLRYSASPFLFIIILSLLSFFIESCNVFWV